MNTVDRRRRHGPLARCLVTLACLAGLWLPASGAAKPALPKRIVVDPTQVLAPVNPRGIGINLNYLMDDDRRRPKRPVRSLVVALKELGVRVLRFPGGDKSDSHLWSTPPYTQARPAMVVSGEWDWPAMDVTLMMPDRKTFRIDPLDFDEYMQVARALKAESVLVVPVDPGFREPREHYETVSMDDLIRNAVEWVKYAKRHAFPVRCWEIGNESYFETSAKQYAKALVRFSQAMKQADPQAKIGAVGVYGDQVGKADRERGKKFPWNQVILETAADHLDYLIVHDYPNWDWKSYEGYLDRDPDFTSGIRRTREVINRWASGTVRARIRIALTEYNAIDYAKNSWRNVSDLGHALLLFNMVGQYLAEPALDSALMWNTRWIKNGEQPPAVHDALAPDNSLYPSGMVLAIWSKFLGSEMLRVEDGTLLKVFATHTPETGALNILLINKGLSAHDLTVQVKHYGKVEGDRWQYAGDGPNDTQPVWENVGAVALADGRLALTLPPVSLTVLAF